VRRIDAEQDVVHAGIAHHHHLVDPLGEHAGLGAELLHVLVEQPHDTGVELRRLPGLNWAKAMRDIRSAPNTAWGLRLDTEASCSPDSSSISDDTTLVVPMSMARPNFMSAVSPASTARMRRPSW